jgi:hypothetical protein
MNKDILRLAGVINENEGQDGLYKQHLRYAETTGMYQAMAGIVRRKLEIHLKQLENPEWTREEDSRIMLDHLEKAVREALAEMDRTERKIKELGS